MTHHLSAQEQIEALEGVLVAARQRHLEGCAACAGEAAALRTVWGDVREAGGIPDPSPLFWDHFQARVHSAIAEDAARTAVGSPWWQGSVRSFLVVGAAALVVIAVAIAPRVVPSVAVPDDTLASAASEIDALTDQVQWQFMVDVLGSLETDAVQSVLVPSARGVDAAFETLSGQERATFLRLLEAELSAGSE